MESVSRIAQQVQVQVRHITRSNFLIAGLDWEKPGLHWPAEERYRRSDPPPTTNQPKQQTMRTHSPNPSHPQRICAAYLMCHWRRKNDYYY